MYQDNRIEIFMVLVFATARPHYIAVLPTTPLYLDTHTNSIPEASSLRRTNISFSG